MARLQEHIDDTMSRDTTSNAAVNHVLSVRGRQTVDTVVSPSPCSKASRGGGERNHPSRGEIKQWTLRR
jgi:hypothetical protein